MDSFQEPPKKKQKTSSTSATTTVPASTITPNLPQKKSINTKNIPEHKDEDDTMLDLSTITLKLKMSNITGINAIDIEFDEDESLKEMIRKIEKMINIDGDEIGKLEFAKSFGSDNKIPKSYSIKIADKDVIDFKRHNFTISSDTRFIEYWHQFFDEANKYIQQEHIKHPEHVQYEGNLAAKLQDNQLKIGDATITFQRTLRIPDDDKTYPLPPSLGQFDIVKVQDYMTSDGLPQKWKKRKGVIIPMWQKEAMWMSFSATKPCLVIHLLSNYDLIELFVFVAML